MKTCPKCQTQYTDETLRFCLQDGTMLDMPADTGQRTVSIPAEETVVSATDDSGPDSQVTQWKQPGRVRQVVPPPSSNIGRTVGTAVLATLLILGLIGLAGWLYMRNDNEVAANVNVTPSNQNMRSTTNRNSTRPASPTPAQPPAATPSNTNSALPENSPVPNTQIDKQQAFRDISEQINDWKSLSELGDLDAYMSNYADNVNYYRRNNVNKNFIRRDKQQAFQKFDSVTFDITNMDVKVDDSGDRATAAFDKEWVFEGARRSTGKVRQQLQFRKVDEQWLITSERDVKVYYTN